jgi:hypothetical protein
VLRRERESEKQRKLKNETANESRQTKCRQGQEAPGAMPLSPEAIASEMWEEQSVPVVGLLVCCRMANWVERTESRTIAAFLRTDEGETQTTWKATQNE